MNLTEALEVSNLVFLLPMVLGVIFLALSILGTETDSDHDFGHELDGINDISGKEELLNHFEGGLMDKMLSIFGIGKVPFSILATCWLFIYGFIGMTLNSVFGRSIWMISMVIALVGSLILTSFLSRLLAKIMPKAESYGSKLADFVNHEATITILNEDKTKGQAYLYDTYGNAQNVSIKSDSPLSKNAKVILLTYNREENSFNVKQT